MAVADARVPAGRDPEQGTTWDIAGRTSHPARAFANLLARDHLFTTRLGAEARQLAPQVAHVDVDTTPDAFVAHVARLLDLGAGH